jgi:opacity protein-like surface antigen
MKVPVLAKTRSGRGSAFAAGAILVGVFGWNGALAQVPPQTAVTPNCTFTSSATPFSGINNLNVLAVPSAAVSSSLAGAISNVNTIFLGQQGSAFVSAPPNPIPNQPGGGVWGRVIGGEVTVKSTSVSSGTAVSANPAANTSITTSCSNSQKNDFVGAQVGQDIARLNMNDWNLHLGTTAGYLSNRANDGLAGTSTKFEVPFWGAYLVATRGRFFADVLVRQEFYNINFNAPADGYNNQPIGARGASVTVSAGYNFDLGNNWFIEPSAGFVYSRTKVDSFNSVGSPGFLVSGTNSINDIESELGRLSVRAGTTVTLGNWILQPFATANVFHEFAGNVTANFSTFPNSLFFNPPVGPPVSFTQTTSTSRIGTYGQYSLGLAGQLLNTGWLGYVRIDYRNGNNLDGWTGNAGVRYQFTPETIAAVMPTKAPVKARGPLLGPVNWTGFYVGGFTGIGFGTDDIRFVGDPGNSGAKTWVVGALGGAQFGYNYQVNQWVFGVEGEVGAVNIHGGRACGTGTGLLPTGFPAPGPAGFSPAFMTCNDRLDWIATATARVGYAYERGLYYIKGGAAFTNDRVSIGCIIDPSQNGLAGGAFASRQCANQAGVITNGFGASSDRVGWTIGYGAEFDLGNNWSAKAEWDYIDFGRKTTLASDGATFLSDHPTISQVKIGLNYRFGGPASVIAKY